MNVQASQNIPDPALWEKPEMRDALRAQDITAVFTRLTHAGISQRVIAKLTDIDAGEVSRITRGLAQVQAYAVLDRIARGLGIPRGHLGLAYSTDGDSPSPAASAHNDEVFRRSFLGMAGKLAVGAALTSVEQNLLPVAPGRGTPPSRIGESDVRSLQRLTQALRAHDAAHGGGSCQALVLTALNEAESLRAAAMSAQTRQSLLSIVADLRILAGWTAHDLGRETDALRHLLQATEDTHHEGDHAHKAVAMHHLGRVPLDNGNPAEALKIFQLGQIAGQDSLHPAVLALLHTDAALAHAYLGSATQAVTALHRAEDEFARQRDVEAPDFLAFFDRRALEFNAARVQSTLALTDTAHRALAIDRLSAALSDAPAARSRQRAFNLTSLAACALAEGDLDNGISVGHEALTAVRVLQSPRLIAHLMPLQEQAAARPGSDTDQLARDIKMLQPAARGVR